MSRAFTKEDDAGDELPERPVSSGPNYVTPRGLELLRAAGRELVARKQAALTAGDDVKPIDRDLRYLESRINSAVVVSPGSGPEARFGARVILEEETGQRKTFQIVGEDEARTDPGFLPWSGPLAIAMLGAKAGDNVSWEGADTPVQYKVITVEYPNPIDGKR